MATQDKVDEPTLITVKKAQAHGLFPLTIAQPPDTHICIGDGASSRRYIEWLATEQERITRHGDRQAEIVEDGKGEVSLWVNPVVE
jgi:hypothetical protein